MTQVSREHARGVALGSHRPGERVGLAAEQLGERVRDAHGRARGVERDHRLLPETLLEEVLTLASARAVQHGAVERLVSRTAFAAECELQTAGAGAFVVVAQWVPGTGLCSFAACLEPGAEVVLDE